MEDNVFRFVKGPEHAAKTAYDMGFNDGFEAAVQSLERMAGGLEGYPDTVISPIVISGLRLCRERELQVCGREVFVVPPTPTVGGKQ